MVHSQKLLKISCLKMTFKISSKKINDYSYFSLTPAGESIPSKTTTAGALVRALGINTSRVHIAKCSLLYTFVIV